MSRILTRVVCTFLLAQAMAGCIIHPPTARLPVPPPTASYGERRAAFQSLRPEGMQVTDVTYLDRMAGRHERFIGEVTLADGTKLRDPELLLSGVDTGSNTEDAVLRYQHYRRAAHRGLWIGRGLILGAVAVFATAFAFDDHHARNAMWIASGALFFGWVGSRFALRHAIRHREMEVERAFRSFDADLATHLHLCVDGDNVRDCR